MERLLTENGRKVLEPIELLTMIMPEKK